MAASRRAADDGQTGIAATNETEARSTNRTTHSQQHNALDPSLATHLSAGAPPPFGPPAGQITSSTGYSELHLAPATRTSVVTTTTTTTVHFAPILLPRTKAVRPSYSSFSGPPPTTPRTSFANFIEAEERRADGGEDALRLDPKLYPLSQAAFPGGIKRFRMELGGLQGVFYEDGRQAAMERAEREQTAQEEAESREGGEGVDGQVGRLDKGKGRATSVGQVPTLVKSDRGPLNQRRVARRPRASTSANGGGSTIAEEDDDMIDLDSLASPRLSPGPPRKRPRADSRSQSQRSASIDSDGGQPIPPISTLPPAMQGLAATAASLPSPNMSPPSPVPTFAGEDSQEEKKEVVVEENVQAQQLDLDQPQLDIASGQTLSGLLSLPDFVNTFDQLSPALQSYFLFTFLKRSSIPVLQMINNIVTPALRRDFLTDLPPELGVQILGYLDAKTLCRASVVCKGWRRLADGEWRVWKERLMQDELWIGDGSEEREAKEIAGGSKDDLFLKRWRAGVWDQRSRTTWSGKVDDDIMNVDNFGVPSGRRPSVSVKLASPSSSRESSPFSYAHFTHPYKTLYRRRFETRRNWAEKTPKRTTFTCNANNVVTCLQFDKDKIVSASDDHSINVFDTRTGAYRARLSGHDGGVWALQYIGNTLVSGSTDRTIRVWDLDRNKCTHVFVGHTSTVRCLQIVEPENVNPDPSGAPIWEPPYPVIVTGSRDWSLRVWKLPAPGKDAEYHPVIPESPTEENTDASDNPFHVRHLAGHRHAVRALAAHGRTLVSGSYDCQVRVWDILTGDCRHRLVGHLQKVYSVVYDHRRQQCASGSMDGTVRLWSTDSGECIATLDGHSSLVGLLGLSFRNLVSAAADSTLRIWDPKTGECRHTLAAHSGAITCFQHDDYKVISGSDGTLKMWDVRDGSFTRDLLTGLTGVWQISFDQRFCVAAVQRNGLSEFEILDFGAVDPEEIAEEEERDRKDRCIKIEDDSDESSASDEDMGMGRRSSMLGLASGQSRVAATLSNPSSSTTNDQPRPSGSRPPPTMLRPAEFPAAADSTRNDDDASTSTPRVRRTARSRVLQAGSSSGTATPSSFRDARSSAPGPSSRRSEVLELDDDDVDMSGSVDLTGEADEEEEAGGWSA